MEPAELPPMREIPTERPSWALTGAKDREQNLVNSLYMGVESLEELNNILQQKLRQIEMNEVRYETWLVEDAELVLVAFGTAARVAKTAVHNLREQGYSVGLFRPITLWPFPEDELAQLAQHAKGLFVVEMNAGQMLNDVRMVAGREKPIKFLGRMGGAIPLPEEIEREAKTFFTQLDEIEPQVAILER